MAKKNFFTVIPNRAGADMGSDEVFIHISGQEVKCFKTHTKGLKESVRYLQSYEIKSVAMEATGVYWINFYEMCEKAGLDPWLVNPKYTKTRAGKKTDVQDAMWIQQLHSADLLEKSFMPIESIRALRTYVRTREKYIQERTRKINRMTKALIQMNVRIDTVISQIHGISGLKMIEAILQGHRRASYLLNLCDTRIQKNKAEQMKNALQGNYQQEYLFTLEKALEDYKYINSQIMKCDEKIEEHLIQISKKMAVPKTINKPKPIRHNKPHIENFQLLIQTMTNGVDVTRIPGLTNYSALRLISELGSEMSAWPSKKHFTSYLDLSPRQNRSGKSNRRPKVKRTTPKAGQIFREAANSVMNSKNQGLGVFGRKLRSRKGPQIAIKALARKIAEMYYMSFTKGIEYVEVGIEKYELKMKAMSMKNLEKHAKSLGYLLVQV